MMLNNTHVHPIKDRVLVRLDPSTKITQSGLYIPDGAENWPTTGTVLEVGPDVEAKVIEPGVRVFFKSRPSSDCWLWCDSR